MPQRATLRKAPTVANRSPNGGLLLHCAKTNSILYPCRIYGLCLWKSMGWWARSRESH